MCCTRKITNRRINLLRKLNIKLFTIQSTDGIENVEIGKNLE